MSRLTPLPHPLRKYVLVPGFDGTGLLHDDLRAALAPSELVVLDYPTDRALGYAELETELAARLPTDAPFVLIGESFGGPLAIRLAARAPRGLAGLVLCATFARLPRMLRFFGPFTALAPTQLVGAGLAALPLLGSFNTPERRALLARAMAAVPQHVVRARLRAVLEVDACDALAKVTVPMLYLRAKHDRVVPAFAGDAIVAARPDMKLVGIDGPHFLLQVAAPACAAALRTFVADTVSA